LGTSAESDEEVMNIVSDTGPLLHLYEAQALNLLKLIGKVHIPKAVDIEMDRHEVKWLSQRPEWILVDILTSPHDKMAIAWQQVGLLDPGEAEAIALTQQIKTDWFLTDEALARLLGRSLGLEVHGSLGVVLWAAALGHLTRSEAEAILDRLRNSSLWVSTRVFAEAKATLDRLLT
jgi:predicted nucleic acid-binding protein